MGMGTAGIIMLRKHLIIGVSTLLIVIGATISPANAWPDPDRMQTQTALPGTSITFGHQPVILSSGSNAFLQPEVVIVGTVAYAQDRKPQPAHRTVANDPFEKLNRVTFGLNNTLDRYLLVPISKGYRKVTTKKMRKALRNFLNNGSSSITFVNDILQFRFGRAAKTGSRFIINSALGFGGMADPATRLGIPDHTEDFGQTLAVWGVPSGPYLVVPLNGPSTLRDSIGQTLDGIFFSPLNYIRTGAAQKARLSRTGATIIALREPLIEPLEDIEKNSLDYYASFRSFYLQARRREILNGETIPEELPDIGDGFDEFDDFDDFDDFDSATAPTSEDEEARSDNNNDGETPR